MIDKTLIIEMFKLQDQFNEYTTENWKQANLNWGRAIWLESAEAVESLPWKWWKYQDADMANLRVELIDIWHFAMSYIMVNKPEIIEDIDNNIGLFEFEKHNGAIDMQHLINKIEHISTVILDSDYGVEDLISALISTWCYIGNEVDDLYKEYIIKNSLNKFRQDNGYKDATYRKIWILDGEDVEDNVVAWKLSEGIETDSNMFENLYTKLNEYYISYK